MNRKLLDSDTVLSKNEHWKQLDIQWGPPVDLDTEEQEIFTPETASCFSTLEKKATFDSAVVLKKIHDKIVRSLARESTTLNYENFLRDLNCNDSFIASEKQKCYHIGGEMISADSANNICEKIEVIFKSIEKLSTITSTVRHKGMKKCKKRDIVECSISTTGLSFDETRVTEDINMDTYIDEVFRMINETLDSLELKDKTSEEIQASVSTLVKRFSTFLCSPVAKGGRRKKQSSNKFKDLTEFWKIQSCT